MNKTDLMILAAGAAAAAFILLRKPAAAAAATSAAGSAGTGSPENLYSGVTAAQAAQNRAALERQLGGADFWI